MEKLIALFDELYPQEIRNFYKASEMLYNYALACKNVRPLPESEETVMFKRAISNSNPDVIGWAKEIAEICKNAIEHVVEKGIYHTTIECYKILTEPLTTREICKEGIEKIFNAIAEEMQERYERITGVAYAD